LSYLYASFVPSKLDAQHSLGHEPIVLKHICRGKQLSLQRAVNFVHVTGVYHWIMMHVAHTDWSITTQGVLVKTKLLSLMA